MSGDRTSVYLELAKEHYAWDRYHEAQRSTICRIISIFAGLFGIMFVYKQYERMKYHQAVFEWYRSLIGEELSIDFEKEKRSMLNSERYAKISPVFKHVSLHYYWSFLMLFVVLIGLYVVFGLKPVQP